MWRVIGIAAVIGIALATCAVSTFRVTADCKKSVERYSTTIYCKHIHLGNR